ncbi:conserved hypothetical protein [Burkholderia sp. 8Y]|nr:conserved hypothetical protein [Burkholderia sp. 8Y]
MRATDKKGEDMRAIVVSVFLLLHLSAAFAGGETPEVFDAQGKFVGALDDYGGPGVYLTVNGAVAFVPIERVIVSGDGGPQTVYSATQFRWSGMNAVDFTSSDCSGTPVITLTTGVRPSTTIRLGNDVTLYVAPAINSAPVTIGSVRSGPTFTCAAASTPVTEYGWFTESTFSLTGAYPEPLTIRIPADMQRRWR